MTTNTKRKPGKKAHVIKSSCVACGSCLDACKTGAIKIIAGVFADINTEICVGCAKCAAICPASTIEIVSERS